MSFLDFNYYFYSSGIEIFYLGSQAQCTKTRHEFEQSLLHCHFRFPTTGAHHNHSGTSILLHENNVTSHFIDIPVSSFDLSLVAFVTLLDHICREFFDRHV